MTSTTKWEKEYWKKFDTKKSKPKEMVNEELSKITGQKMSAGTITKVKYIHATDPKVIKFIQDLLTKRDDTAYAKGIIKGRKQQYENGYANGLLDGKKTHDEMMKEIND